ncbi:hypothetical protein [Zooshikella sp. RANM57]|uniref:hypothetical protein n=1 Tax=Zooshikella sp. RANM57 TaxID=3425863 RepID=UPI003D6F3946
MPNPRNINPWIKAFFFVFIWVGLMVAGVYNTYPRIGMMTSFSIFIYVFYGLVFSSYTWKVAAISIGLTLLYSYISGESVSSLMVEVHSVKTVGGFLTFFVWLSCVQLVPHSIYQLYHKAKYDCFA